MVILYQRVWLELEDLTPQAQDEYMANRPTQLDEVVVYPKSGKGAKSTTIGSYYDTMNTLTEQNRKHAEEVAKQDALVRETSAFEKPLNFLSPGQYLGAVDYFQGESPFWKGVYNGNSGWLPENFVRNNPRTSLLLNTFLDSAFTYGAGRTYKWGTTPRLIGEGAESKVYTAPFWTKVYKVGLDPEYVAVKNSIPEFLPYKFEGYNLNGSPIYSQFKVPIPKSLKLKNLSKLYQRLASKGYYPNELFGHVDAVNPVNGMAITDLGVGNIGKIPFFGYKIIDPSILDLRNGEYMSLYYKYGENINKKNKYQTILAKNRRIGRQN